MRKNPTFEPELDYAEFIKSEKYFIHFIHNKSLTVWDLENGSTVYDQLCDFTFIQVYKNLILLETWEEEFQVRNIETGQIEYEYKGMTRVDIMDGKIIFTTTDDVIHILKWPDKSEVTLKFCNQTIDRTLMVRDDFLLSFCQCSSNIVTLCVWDIRTKTKLHSTILKGLYYTRDSSIINKYLCLEKMENGNCLIELWDYTKGTVVTIINRLYSNLNLSNDHFLIARNSDKIGLWCFRTLEFICEIGLSLYFFDYIEDIELNRTKIVILDLINSLVLTLNVRDYEI